MTLRRTPLAVAALLALLPSVAAAQTPIRVGQTVAGTLNQSDPRMSSDNTLYDDYVIQATSGQRLVITLQSGDFDAFLIWGTGAGGSFVPSQNDDDGGGGTNSRLEVTVGESGRYTIRANALRENESGRYSLSVAGPAAAGPSGPSGPPPGPGGAVRPLTAGQTVSGSLDRSDPRLDDESYYDLYVYRGRPNERIVVTMRSRAFDTYLAGGSLGGGGFRQQASDDDGAGGTDSRLEATLGSDGVYAIRANSLLAGQTGAYTISLSSGGGGGGNQPASGNTLSVGQTVDGRLDTSDRRLERDNSHYDTYVVRGQPNQAVSITMTSRAFDAYLIGGPGPAGEAVDSDDDGAGGTNARLQVNLDASGAYTVYANSLRANETGAYTLTVEGGATAGPAQGTGSRPAIALGQTVEGRLDSSDPRLSDNSYYDQYVYRGSPGQQVVITMASRAFDTYLTWGRMSGSQVQTEASDDDSGGGTNSQLVATVPSNGIVVIQANSLGADQTGAYTLSLAGASGTQTQTRPAPAGAATVTAGQTITGSLARTDPMAGDSSYFDQYIYRGSPGDRLRITLQSSAFDAYLVWGRLEDEGSLADAEQDDDGAGGTNSQLEVTVGGTGLYAVRANSFGPQQTGAYTLNVQRVGTGTTASRPTQGPSRPTNPTRPTGPSSGGNKWRYAYTNPNTPAFRNLEQRMKQAQLLELFSEQLTSRFELPANAQVEMRLAQCGNINAFYSPRDHAVTLCYELLQHLANRFVTDGRWTPQQEEAVRGAINFIMMHEVGHALIHVRDLPITGREEDAVDQLATVMLIETGEKGAEAALNGVLAIQPGRDAVFDQTDFADEHSLGPQRLYNVVCWIYGSDPTKYAAIAQRAGLPPERARRCRDEYDRLSKAWTRLLEN
jgi:hypothetical protein